MGWWVANANNYPIDFTSGSDQETAGLGFACAVCAVVVTVLGVVARF